MQIVLRRLKANQLYTEGVILVNETPAIPYAVEHTFTMLPIGEYQLRLTKDKKRKRVIGIFPTGAEATSAAISPMGYFEAGHSFLSARAHGTIVMGEFLIPGAVKKGREHYERLFDRIEKCEHREESITLLITDDQCRESKPIGHWLH